MSYKRNIYIILTLFLLTERISLGEIPEIIQNWSSLTNPREYKMDFYAVYTQHYTNEILKDVDDATGKIITNVVRSYIPETPITKTWHGSMYVINDPSDQESRRIKMETTRENNDQITTMTHYVTTINVLSLNHTSQIARQTKSIGAPFMLEWPFWVPTHPCMQNTNFITGAWKWDFVVAGKTQNDETIIKLDMDKADYHGTIKFDINGFITEFNDSEKHFIQHYKFKYILTEQGIFLMDCIIERYYKDSLMPDIPMETFEFHAYPDTISFQNVDTFSQFPVVPRGYEFIDHISGVFTDRNEIQHPLLTEVE